MSFSKNFVKINENKVVCIWKFKKKWAKLKKNKEKIQISVGKAEKQGKIAKNGKKAGKKNFKKKRKNLEKVLYSSKKVGKT